MSIRSTLALTRLRARKLGRALSRKRYRSALRQGVLASTDHQDAGLGKAFATVLDVGASRGQFATFARETWSNARIICFEPLPESAQRIQAIVDGPLEVHVQAVGAKSGCLTFHVSGHDDSSSLLPIARQADEFPGTAVTGVREVPVGTLAEHMTEEIARPALLKIDVQGYELEALRGAGDGLDRIDEILCECSFVELYSGQTLASEVISYLDDRDFTLAHISSIASGADGRQLQADFTFRRKSDQR
jgi:FkbM family methyltransferase